MSEIRVENKSFIAAMERFLYIVRNILRMIKSFVFPPILIYSMGKAGSTSVWVSLAKAHIKNPIFRTHRLSWNTLKESHTYYRNAGVTVPIHIANGSYLRFFIDKTRGKVRWKIISLTRDPIATKISNLFETLKNYPQLRNLTGDELINGIFTELQKRLDEFGTENDHTSNWFNLELKDVFGFDVYAENFDPAAGYKITKTENADILIIKLEDLSRCGREAFQKFLGLRDFQLVKANEGFDKSYKEIYQRILKTISLPRETTDRIYGSRYARQFYTDEEINTFKRRWTSKD
jgi:Putative capsular polysaccharide synthesis protein